LRDVADELRGAQYLSWRNGNGAARLLGFDGRRMLLEYAGERLLLDELREHGDGAATDIAADLLRTLHAPLDTLPPADLQPLHERFEALFRKAETDRKAGRTSFYVEASQVAERLLANPRDVRPLHGDLHHQNVIFGQRGWLAIDPKGVLGDRAFDASNLFYNPLGNDDLCRNPMRIAHMAKVFAGAIDRNEDALLDHALAYGCLSAAWHAEDGSPADELRTLSIAAAVRAVRA
jgi:streptomycin 6-kinase